MNAIPKAKVEISIKSSKYGKQLFNSPHFAVVVLMSVESTSPCIVGRLNIAWHKRVLLFAQLETKQFRWHSKSWEADTLQHPFEGWEQLCSLQTCLNFKHMVLSFWQLQLSTNTNKQRSRSHRHDVFFYLTKFRDCSSGRCLRANVTILWVISIRCRSLVDDVTASSDWIFQNAHSLSLRFSPSPLTWLDKASASLFICWKVKTLNCYFFANDQPRIDLKYRKRDLFS